MAIDKQKMSVWLCPKCNRRERQPSFIKEVAHNCPMAKGNVPVEFKIVG